MSELSEQLPDTVHDEIGSLLAQARAIETMTTSAPANDQVLYVRRAVKARGTADLISRTQCALR
jgi:hypothetical protein